MCLTTLALAISIASTHHVGGDYNETNPGLGIEVPTGECSYVTAGAYENSHSDTTIYAGGGWDTNLVDFGEFKVDGGVMVAATYGYDLDFPSPIDPIGGLTLSAGTETINVRALHVPMTFTGFQVRVGF